MFIKIPTMYTKLHFSFVRIPRLTLAAFYVIDFLSSSSPRLAAGFCLPRSPPGCWHTSPWSSPCYLICPISFGWRQVANGEKENVSHDIKDTINRIYDLKTLIRLQLKIIENRQDWLRRRRRRRKRRWRRGGGSRKNRQEKDEGKEEYEEERDRKNNSMIC